MLIEGRVTIQVVGCRNIKLVERPYVKLRDNRKQHHSFKTKHGEKSTAPHFGESFSFDVSGSNFDIQVVVEAHHLLKHEEVLGVVNLSISDFRFGSEVNKWFSLKNGEGEVHLLLYLIDTSPHQRYNQQIQATNPTSFSSNNLSPFLNNSNPSFHSSPNLMLNNNVGLTPPTNYPSAPNLLPVSPSVGLAPPSVSSVPSMGLAPPSANYSPSPNFLPQVNFLPQAQVVANSKFFVNVQAKLKRDYIVVLDMSESELKKFIIFFLFLILIFCREKVWRWKTVKTRRAGGSTASKLVFT